MAEPALFPEPEHTPARTDGLWLIAPPPGCWRYMVLGEDGQFLMIAGHGIRDGELVDVVRAADVYEAAEEATGHWADIARLTWARQHDTCPKHLAYVDDCHECRCFKAGEGPWWDWSTQPGEPADANRDKPGYFAATVIDLEG